VVEYAKGKRAWGQDARTGERTLLKNLVRDGNTGLPVLPKNYEPKHPQEFPVPIYDPVALRRPAPDQDRVGEALEWPTIPLDSLFQPNPPLIAIASLTPGTPVIANPVLVGTARITEDGMNRATEGGDMRVIED